MLNGDTPSNDVIRDNVLQHGVSNECGCTWGTENHNLGGGLNGTGDLNGKPVISAAADMAHGASLPARLERVLLLTGRTSASRSGWFCPSFRIELRRRRG